MGSETYRTESNPFRMWPSLQNFLCVKCSSVNIKLIPLNVEAILSLFVQSEDLCFSSQEFMNVERKNNKNIQNECPVQCHRWLFCSSTRGSELLNVFVVEEDKMPVEEGKRVLLNSRVLVKIMAKRAVH
ncbi:hypothetical protein JZ751_022791 [Albula glossodonta]|uniref:Uncharacterized protein n=1 Tax=Albula glossodonta TaxID=121402 RepID=A0A8T2PH92_9TELE|nr:hypothetical protein JZ751_022791 [Albula glossodonta]